LKISFVAGVCVHHDAISDCIRREICAIGDAGLGTARLYSYNCEFGDVSYLDATRLSDIAFDPHFQASELVVFHFGVYCQFFDLLPVSPRQAKRMVVFHNITPKELVSRDKWDLIDRSHAQASNMAWADHIVCDSPTNLDAMRKMGIQVPASVIPPAVRLTSSPPADKPSFRDDLVRIAFLGRFVHSKGPEDLLASIGSVLDHAPGLRVRLDLVGNLAFSDAAVVERVQRAAEALKRDNPRRFDVQLSGSASDEVKCRILCEADLFVLPTYHEGFGVPILEALASGCKVIAYDNSNVPIVSGGFATLVPTGDARALATAIECASDEVLSADWREQRYRRFVAAASKYLERFAPEKVNDEFLNRVRSLTRAGAGKVIRETIQYV
jgi:glycosyltransferase involved in cell wall biosynthesis